MIPNKVERDPVYFFTGSGSCVKSKGENALGDTFPILSYWMASFTKDLSFSDQQTPWLTSIRLQSIANGLNNSQYGSTRSSTTLLISRMSLGLNNLLVASVFTNTWASHLYENVYFALISFL